MAAFCGNCGARVQAGAKFCESCGAAVSSQPVRATPAAPTAIPTTTPAATPVPSSVSAAPVPSQGSSTALKVILAVLGFFALMAMLVVGSCFYIGYRVKQRAHEFSQSLGANTAPYTGRRIPCAMMSAAEASSALGQPVTSFSQRGMNACQYQFGPGGSQRLNVEYTWQGGALAMGLAHGAMKISGVEPVQGIGDEAYVAPDGSAFMMRKGDVMVNIDLRSSGVSVEAAQQMAGKIASHL